MREHAQNSISASLVVSVGKPTMPLSEYVSLIKGGVTRRRKRLEPR